MAIVTQISWDDMLDGKPLPENPARQAWREAVAEIADKAKAALPEAVNGRIEKAVAIVLSGDVELLGDGKAKVASQSNGTTQYVVCNGTCECRDFARVEGGWCKHRTAAAIAKRAYPLAKAKLDTASAPTSALPAPTLTGTVYCAACQATFHAPHECPRKAAPLPEAPASVNVYLELAGRQVQVTLRDSDESRLLARLDAILQRFPLVVKPTDTHARPEGWCSKHGIQMRQNDKDGRTWYSHKTADGWCKGK